MLGTFMMSERRGLFCRYDCEVNGRPWYVLPKTTSSSDDLQAAVATRDAHEIAEHGKVFMVFVPEPIGRFNQTFSQGKKKT
jgi:hypothetical protein